MSFMHACMHACMQIPAELLCLISWFHLGVVGILWFFLWFFIGFSSPASHPRISEKEREYIETSIIAQGVKEEVGNIKDEASVTVTALLYRFLHHGLRS